MENNEFTNWEVLVKEKQNLILKGEENGFIFNNGSLFKKIDAKDRYISFELEEYYGNNTLRYPKFGFSTFPLVRGFDFSLGFFDTYNTPFAYSIITSVFDSIVNFFQDGENILEKYRYSYQVIQSELHVVFATNDGDKITFSSSGRYFRGRLIRNSEEENNDLYGV